MDKCTFILSHAQARQNAIACVREAPEGYAVVVREPTRTLDQNSLFHAICSDIAKQCKFAGAYRSMHTWKMLLISGHAVATKLGVEMAPGLEGEWVNLRESSASMSKSRLSSLVDYSLAYGAQNNVKFSG